MTSKYLDIDIGVEDLAWEKQMELSEQAELNSENKTDIDVDDVASVVGDDDDDRANIATKKTNDNDNDNDDDAMGMILVEKKPIKNKMYQQHHHIQQQYLRSLKNRCLSRPKEKFKAPILTISAFEHLKELNTCIILVDLQFVGSELVEMSIARPDLPIVFHDVYPLCQLNKQKLYPNPLSNIKYHKEYTSKTIDNNLRYLNMSCCRKKNAYHNYPLKNNEVFFHSLPHHAIYVLRGYNKHTYWCELLKQYNKSGDIYLFAETFYNPIHERKNGNNSGQITCISHFNKNSACSLANVRHMALFYKHCDYMFNNK